jgi:heat shock protein HtpX
MLISFNEVRKNKIKSIFLMSFFIIIIGLLGAIIGFIYGSLYFGLGIAIVIAIIYSLIALNVGGNMVLAMSGARPVTKKEFPYLYHTIEGIAVSAGLPTPKAYVIEDTAINAFATGKDPEHASITVTTGLLNIMNRQELEGVIAHEMSHIKNFDIRFMMLTAVMVGIVVLLSDFLLRTFLWSSIGGRRRSSSGKSAGQATFIFIAVGLVLAILTPLIGEMIKMAISRKREFMADASATTMTRYPPGLASALRKISKDTKPEVEKANKAIAHLFISSPFRRKKSFISGLFSTHPPIEERISKLEAM